MFWRLLLESFVRQRRRKALAGVAILLGTTAVTAMLALATTIGDRIHRELGGVWGEYRGDSGGGCAGGEGGWGECAACEWGGLFEGVGFREAEGDFWANNITGVSPEYRILARMLVDERHWWPLRPRALALE